MFKPELLVPAGSLKEIERYLAAGADAFVVGEDRFGLRLPGEMKPDEIAAASAYAHAHGARLYVAVNNVFANDDLEALAEYLRRMGEIGPDAIVFGDPAVIVAMRELGVSLPLHWNAEMTSTNYAAAEYWATHGAVRVVAARELNLEELHAFKRRSKLELQVQVHGMTNIYHSRRRLLHSYLGHIGREVGGTGMQAGLYLIEHERPNDKLPIYEDRNGTHIMSPDDICLLEVLPELMEEPIDSLKIETLLKPVEYNEAVIRIYRQAIDAWAERRDLEPLTVGWLKEIRALQHPGRELSFGFLYKEQVY
jgi:putative protease